MKFLKPIIAFFLFSITTNTSFSQSCLHTVRFTDTYGDGWTGGTVTITVNGVNVPTITDYELLVGSGPEDLTFTASTGDMIRVIKTNTSTWPGEMRVEVFDFSMTAIIPLHEPLNAPGTEGEGNCTPPVTVPTNAPGGVSGIRVWLKANANVYSGAGITPATDGGTIQQWNENSGNTAFTSVSQSVTAKRPIYRTGEFNYNPVVSTEDLAAPHFMQSSDITDTDLSASGNLTFYGVNTQSAGAVAYLWNAQSQSKFGFQGNFAFCQGDVSPSTTINLGSELMPAVKTVEHTDASGVVKSYYNNEYIATTTNDGLSTGNYFDPYSIGALPGGGWPGEVKIGEILYFDGVHSTTDRTRVSTYLAIKYGTLLDNTGGGIAGDYLATDGTNIWDADLYPVYHNNVIGIGRDTDEELEQKQSHTADDTTRIYLNTLQTTNETNTGSFTENVSYVLMGHDLGLMYATVASNAELPIGLTGCALYSRLEREWKVTKTNMVDDFSWDIKLSIGAIPTLVDVSHLRLLVDTDDDFSNGGTTCFYNGDGTGIIISYANSTITISGISNTHLPNDMTRFMTIASINVATPLPIKLANFEVDCENGTSTLNWTTVSEQNNAYFTIEKGSDALHFEPITNVNGAGNSSTSINYTWKDDNPIHGLVYYRLKQTDFNGDFKYLGIKTVDCENSTDITIYPNPFNSSFTVHLSKHTLYPTSIEIMDYLGRAVYSRKFAETNAIEITLDNTVPPGYYFIKVSNKSFETTERLVKMN